MRKFHEPPGEFAPPRAETGGHTGNAWSSPWGLSCPWMESKAGPSLRRSRAGLSINFTACQQKARPYLKLSRVT